jgi:hypothetical protein
MSTSNTPTPTIAPTVNGSVLANGDPKCDDQNKGDVSFFKVIINQKVVYSPFSLQQK